MAEIKGLYLNGELLFTNGHTSSKENTEWNQIELNGKNGYGTNTNVTNNLYYKIKDSILLLQGGFRVDTTVSDYTTNNVVFKFPKEVYSRIIYPKNGVYSIGSQTLFSQRATNASSQNKVDGVIFDGTIDIKNDGSFNVPKSPDEILDILDYNYNTQHFSNVGMYCDTIINVAIPLK